MLPIENYLREVLTPDDLIAAVKMCLPPSKTFLAKFLNFEKRVEYMKKCAEIERLLTMACFDKTGGCIDGCECPFDCHSVCLEALLRAEPVYSKICIDEWLNLFQDPVNRIDEWK